MISKAVKVRKNEAEEIRRKLIKEKIMNQNLKVRRDENFVYFPVVRKCDYGEFIEEMEFEEKEKSYIEIAREEGIEIKSIPMDIVGDIAIVRLSDELMEKKERIAKFILKMNKNVKAVYLDRGIHDEHRIRKIEFIGGEKKTETMHVEYGIRMLLDISKVYFSPRLATERMRVAKMIEKGSIVIDMFAGIAPFSLIIAKYSKPKKIYAIDKNPYAIEYARKNIEINKMEGIIEVIKGDAKEIVKKLPHADHIIMNLPHKSYEFLPYAIEKGNIIHYYEIIERGKIEERKKEIVQLCKDMGYNIEIKNVHVVGSYSPAKEKIGMDLFLL